MASIFFIPKHHRMPCAPIDPFDHFVSWTIQTPQGMPASSATPSGRSPILHRAVEEAYRHSLRSAGLSSDDGMTLADRMRELGLLPPIGGTA